MDTQVATARDRLDTITGVKERIIELLQSTQREGMDKLIDSLVDSDFFEAPASTKFHGAYKGALAKHSLKVWGLLSEFVVKTDLILHPDRTADRKPLKVGRNNIVVAALLHDVCKIDTYIPTPGEKQPYKWNKSRPEGHARRSLGLIKKHIRLEAIEEMMIRFHMGIYGLNEFYEPHSWESKSAEYSLGLITDFIADVFGGPEYPMRGDHSKDDKLSKEESQKARYGNSWRNAIYHNPIVLVIYFCDHLAAMEEMAKAEAMDATDGRSV